MKKPQRGVPVEAMPRDQRLENRLITDEGDGVEFGEFTEGELNGRDHFGRT